MIFQFTPPPRPTTSWTYKLSSPSHRDPLSFTLSHMYFCHAIPPSFETFLWERCRKRLLPQRG